MKNVGGWHGNILIINLTRKTWKVDSPDLTLYTSYVGGKALAGYLFSHYFHAAPGALSSPVVIAAGPLAATPVCAAGSATIFSRSPLTGTIGDFSMPGSLGAALKKCGYDAIVLLGEISAMTGLSITEHGVGFEDASGLEGLSVRECRQKISSPFPQLFCGAAAERGIKFANLIIDELWARGRNGLGICFAKKKVKYIRLQGTKLPRIQNPSELSKTQESIRRLVYASPALTGEFGISTYGAGALFDLLDSRRMMATNFFRETVYDGAPSINACRFHKHFSPQAAGCDGCPVQCMRILDNGDSLVDLDAMLSFGPLLCNNSIESIQCAATICNDFGLDPISASHSIATHSKRRGISIDRDLPELLRDMIIYGSKPRGREENDGLGLGESVLDDEFTVKSQHVLPFDPRGAYGLALSMAVSTRGGCDNAFAFSHEILRKPVATDRFSFSGKARMTALMEDSQAAYASLAVCKYLSVAVPLDEYASVLAAVTGIDFDTDALLACGSRAVYQERLLNARFGFSRKDDTIPEHFFSHEGTSGNGIFVPPIPRAEFESALQAYYSIRGLTPDGEPIPKHAYERGLI